MPEVPPHPQRILSALGSQALRSRRAALPAALLIAVLAASGACGTSPAPTPPSTSPAAVSPLTGASPDASASPTANSSADVASSTPTIDATASPSASLSSGPSESASASGSPTVSPVIVTFLVHQQATFSVRLVTAEQIANAQRLLRDGGGPQVPVGAIVRSASPDNPGYDWHLEPATFSFSNVSSSDCAGFPNEIDAGSLATAVKYCPADTTVLRIDPAT